MSLRSSFLAGGAALLLLVVLGNPVTFDLIRDEAPSWARFVALDVALTYNLGLGDNAIDTGPALLRALVIVAVAFVLGGMAGRARPLAALVGGWGAAFGALALGSIVFVLVVDDPFIARSPSPRVIDKVTAGATIAGGVAFWTGWVIALAVLLGRDRRVVRSPKAAPLGGPSPDGAPAYGSPGYDAPGYDAPAAAPRPVGGTFGATPAPAAGPSPFAAPAEPSTERQDVVSSTPPPPAAPPSEVEPPTEAQEPVPSTPPPPPAPRGDGPVIGPPPERT